MDNALFATCAAVEEGILPGGGVALLRALKVLNELSITNQDQPGAVDIILHAIDAGASVRPKRRCRRPRHLEQAAREDRVLLWGSST